MELTKHAASRIQKRCIPPIIVDLLIDYGQSERSGNGTTKYYLDKRSKRRLEAYAGPIAGLLEQHLNCVVVVADGGALVTVEHRLQRIKH